MPPDACNPKQQSEIESHVWRSEGQLRTGWWRPPQTPAWPPSLPKPCLSACRTEQFHVPFRNELHPARHDALHAAYVAVCALLCPGEKIFSDSSSPTPVKDEEGLSYPYLVAAAGHLETNAAPETEDVVTYAHTWTHSNAMPSEPVVLFFR